MLRCFRCTLHYVHDLDALNAHHNAVDLSSVCACDYPAQVSPEEFMRAEWIFRALRIAFPDAEIRRMGHRDRADTYFQEETVDCMIRLTRRFVGGDIEQDIHLHESVEAMSHVVDVSLRGARAGARSETTATFYDRDDLPGLHVRLVAEINVNFDLAQTGFAGVRLGERVGNRRSDAIANLGGA